MRNIMVRTLICLALIFGLASTTFAKGIAEDLMVFFKNAGMASNVTTPGSYQDQTAGFYTGGSFVTRNAVRQHPISDRSNARVSGRVWRY